MKLNRKLWTAALAVAMTTPSAMAAQDTAGMHYTSAAEGFYASIRVRYVSNGGSKDGGADLQDSSSRFGVRGTNDLGGGLEGFYRYEASISTHQGGGLSTRLGHVGLRGDFGSVVAGAFWPDTYNWVYGSTDVANRHSGNAVFHGVVNHAFGQYRTNKSLQYTTPDLNGFQAAILIKADSGSDGQGAVTKDGKKKVLELSLDHVTATSTVNMEAATVNDVSFEKAGRVLRVTAPAASGGGNVRFDANAVEKDVKGNKDDSDVDHWSIVAKYDIAGFSTAFSYSSYADAMKKEDGSMSREDKNSWAAKLGYSQDNWYVNGWYGEINTGDVCNGCDDTEVLSLAGGVTVDKIALYAVHENVGAGSEDDAYSTLGAQYTLGSNSWTWIEYAGRDLDSEGDEDGDFSIGLGHSF